MAIAVMGMLGLSGLASGLVPPAICLCFTYFGLGGIGACYGVAARTYFGAAGYAPTMGMLGPFMMASSFAGAGAGWLRDQFGNYHIVFWILASVLIITLIAAPLLRTMEPAKLKVA